MYLLLSGSLRLWNPRLVPAINKSTKGIVWPDKICTIVASAVVDEVLTVRSTDFGTSIVSVYLFANLEAMQLLHRFKQIWSDTMTSLFEIF